MKLTFCLAFVIFALYANGCLAGPPTSCYYHSIRLGVAIDEETCRERCEAYTNPRKEKCIAYSFDTKRETCSGYGIKYEKSYLYYDTCGVVYGADISFDKITDEAVGSVPADDGCYLTTASLGIASTEQECEDECRNLPSGDVYGGCVAWFYKKSNQQCLGVVSSASSYSVCGTVH